jgi:cyclopropane fatty-acyl-phospholipid synthase-like methyltransferase
MGSMSDAPVARYQAALDSAPGFHGTYRYLARMFDRIPLAGRAVLDVGAGSGLASLYAAAHGAVVTALEPAASGSNPAMEAAYERLRQGIGEDIHVHWERKLLQQFDPGNDRFDVVVINNAINHVDEAACSRLHVDEAARETYAQLVNRLAAWMPSESYLLVADAARRNLWRLLHVRSPFAPTIDWTIHQQPGTWAALFSNAGFTTLDLKWNAHRRLGPLGQLVLGNRVGAFVTNSHFTLRMRKVASDT